MDFAALALEFAIDLVASAAFLWVGMKVASFVAGIPGGGQYCGYVDLLKVALVASVVALIPYVGWALSFVAMYYMLRRVTEAGFREILIMILVSRIAAFVTATYLVSLTAAL
jgi:hypothetical protein